MGEKGDTGVGDTGVGDTGWGVETFLSHFMLQKPELSIESYEPVGRLRKVISIKRGITFLIATRVKDKNSV